MSNLPAEWKDLEEYHRNTLSQIPLASFFVGDEADVQQRVERLKVHLSLGKEGFVHVDLSKNYMTPESIALYKNLAERRNLNDRISELLNGGRLNLSENRNVTHIALRSQKVLESIDEGKPLENLTVLEKDAFWNLKKIKRVCTGVHTGMLRPFHKRRFKHIVNIGIGGSDLGPSMVCDALEEFAHVPTSDMTFHFLSNVDGNAIHDLSHQISLSHTLFIVASKSFTTTETFENVKTIQSLLADDLNVLPGRDTIANREEFRKQFIAVSSRPDNVEKLGIDIHSDYFLHFDEGVGGRYSLWGPVGLSIALKIGFERFVDLLRGAAAVDAHMGSSTYEKSAPFLMACAELTYNNFFHWRVRGVVPYNSRLSKLPSYLQQLEMESNGKSSSRNGDERVIIATCPTVFGGEGTNVQHAFFQLLHQAPAEKIPVDFIIALQKGNTVSDTHQDWLVANCFAQSEALLLGSKKLSTENNQISLIDSEPNTVHRVFDGDRPSTTILLKRLNPQSLGALIALYEHKVFIESILWNINCFDQWGVELGKTIASSIYKEITEKVDGQHDTSTAAMMKLYSERDGRVKRPRE